MSLSGKYDLILPNRAQVMSVATNLRKADHEEVTATHGEGTDVAARVYESWLVSRDTVRVGTANGEPFCVFGVYRKSLIAGSATPWLVGTPELEKHYRRFARVSRAVVGYWQQAFPHLENYVDARNTTSIRWLQWLGFQLYYPEPFGEMGLPFHRFELTRD